MRKSDTHHCLACERQDITNPLRVLSYHEELHNRRIGFLIYAASAVITLACVVGVIVSAAGVFGS